VLVLERESAQGKGSTGKSMGGVRAQFSTPINVQMSLYSIPFYANFRDLSDEELVKILRDKTLPAYRSAQSRS
jgi:sarcosine oxidase subunit beta